MARRININIPSPDKLIQIHPTGQWEQVIAGMDRAGQEVLRGYEDGVAEYGAKVCKIVREAIRSGSPPGGGHWEPLSEHYQKKTRKHTPYDLTGQYYASVGVYSNRKRTWIGMPYNTRYRGQDTRLTLNQIAKILEFGRSGGDGSNYIEGDGDEGDAMDVATSYMPARPLWRPAFSIAGSYEGIRQILLLNIRRRLAASFGLSPNQVRMSGRSTYGNKKLR